MSATRPRSAALLMLGFRRVLSPAFVVMALVLVTLWLFGYGEFSGAAHEGEQNMLRAARRESTWQFLALFAFPCLLFFAAGTGARWRAGDRDWIGSRAITHLHFAASTWCGVWIASALVALTIGLVGELAAGGNGPSARRLTGVPIPTLMLIEDRARATWELGDKTGQLRAGRSLRLELRATPGAGPTAATRFSCRRIASGEISEVEAVVSGRTRVALDLPGGRGDLALTLEKTGSGCGVALLPGSLALYEPLESERGGTLAVLLQTLLWLGAWTAIALGFGTWMGAFTATALTLTLQLPLWTLGALPQSEWIASALRWCPGIELPNALALLGDGLVPALPSPLAIPGLIILVTIGLHTAAIGLNRGGQP